MAAVIALDLAMLAIEHGLKIDSRIEVAMDKRIQQHQEYLHPGMSWLLQDVKHIRAMEEAMLISVLQLWL